MKNAFFGFCTVLFVLLSCRGNDDEIQRIDQTLQLYIDSAGTDMLDASLPGAYINVAMNDINGLTDNAPAPFSIKKDADLHSYLEYIAGARRIRIDSTADFKTYESKIALNLTKKINDSTQVVTNDTLTLQYHFSSTLFQISKVWYNGVLSFTKVEGAPNVIKIQK
ncbi:MAG: hypothetical protein K0M56_09335 [Kaistella sp.]|nr:hypothetical protein [Kaistella sp.]